VTGTKAFEIAGDVKEIYGIDISSKMVEIAKRKATKHKIGNIDFIHATILDERLKKETFDAILTFNVLHLLENYQQAMQRITELLKPEGIFISITPCLAEEMDFRNRLEFYFFLTLMN
jgi:2-polyprenyl-3-methyl-5-hydroxy-6-metoxy-1,4-benzoquinol methylase